MPPGTVEDDRRPGAAAGLAGTPVTVGAAMCPEFLREGSGVADFYASPFMVVGTADPRVADAVTSLFGFLDQPVAGRRDPDGRGAQVRLQRLPRHQGVVRQRDVPAVPAAGRRFPRGHGAVLRGPRSSTSRPAYLRPGFAFGGSCLPKDLRSLLHLARMNSVDLPLLAGTLATNELTISDVVDRVVACDGRTVALLGLSFKMNTDDLRESPNVGAGREADRQGLRRPDLRPGRQPRPPGRRQPPAHRVQAAASGAAAHARARRGAAAAPTWRSSRPSIRRSGPRCSAAPPRHLIDLSGRLGREIEALPGYEGVGW